MRDKISRYRSEEETDKLLEEQFVSLLRFCTCYSISHNLQLIDNSLVLVHIKDKILF